MATPTPDELGAEAFAAAAGEAVQTSVMAFRLVMAIADAVRRQQQKKAGLEEKLPPAEKALAEAQTQVKKFLPPDITTALVKEADWPQFAQQLMALRDAGVDLESMLPRVGEITVTVRDAVTANAERIAREGTDPWAAMLRETMPAGPVREAILASPAWPEMAATMAKLDERGVDVRAILSAAHEEGVGVDQAVAKVLSTASVPTTSRDAMLSYGPLTTGLDMPVDIELSDRERALGQLGIRPSENARYCRMVREAMPGMEQEADLLLASKYWPYLAARMDLLEREAMPVEPRLARLGRDTSWRQGPPGKVGEQLVRAASDSLTRPLGSGESRVRVNTAAARATSTTVGPTKAAKAAAPAEAAGSSTRAQNAAPARGKSR
ncbi:hypothetical protein AB0D00_26330 [Streptomyces sp. NPDC048213]|uniref:hypothetical protein n=1 Tax=Streptomyces sp. NPDC048213 TaxID=3160984 RepID=UPI0033D66038